MESREELIEWVEEHYTRLPNHISALITHAKPINEQATHILRMVKEHTIDFWKK